MKVIKTGHKIFVLVTQYQGQFKIQTMEAIKYKLFQDDISLKPK